MNGLALQCRGRLRAAGERQEQVAAAHRVGPEDRSAGAGECEDRREGGDGGCGSEAEPCGGAPVFPEGVREGNENPGYRGASTVAMHSSSIRAPSASPLVPKALRAGKCFVK